MAAQRLGGAAGRELRVDARVSRTAVHHTRVLVAETPPRLHLYLCQAKAERASQEASHSAGGPGVQSARSFPTGGPAGRGTPWAQRCARPGAGQGGQGETAPPPRLAQPCPASAFQGPFRPHPASGICTAVSRLGAVLLRVLARVGTEVGERQHHGPDDVTSLLYVFQIHISFNNHKNSMRNVLLFYGTKWRRGEEKRLMNGPHSLLVR